MPPSDRREKQYKLESNPSIELRDGEVLRYLYVA